MHKPIGSIFTLVGGGTPSTKDERYWGNGIPWFSSADIDRFGAIKYRKTVTELGVENSTTNIVEQGIVVVVTRVGLGKVALLPCDMCFSQDIQALIPKNTGEVFGPFVFYQLQYIMQSLRYKGQGTTISGITKKQLADVNFYLPVHSEQERIVSKIEELFSKLDASVAELQTAKEKLKVYRQAVLKEAFDSVQVNSKRVTIRSVCETIKVGIVIKPTQYYVEQGGVFAFRNANVRRNYIEDKDWAMISQEGHQKNLKSQVHKGDVLIARSGVNLGMAAAVPQKYDGYNAIDVVIAVPKKEFILPQYLAQYTNSPYGLEIVRKNQHGAAQGHLNVKEYGNLPIFLPNIPEQYSLLEKIESRLSVCDSIEQTIDTSLQQAEALRQSILKQAFEGEL